MRRQRLLFAGLALFVASAAGIACSLGLDPSLIGGNDGGADVATSDVGIDAPNPVQCKADPDCKSSNGCLTGKCDIAKNQCVYAVCPATACNSSVCDNNTHTCSSPTAYNFHAGTFHVSLGSAGCGGGGGGARRCFAAVYPFVFIGTTNGVVAYPVDSPTNGTPVSIPVAGLPFFPTFVVTSGTTIYFVGAVAGTGPDYKIPIASLAVPTDPTISEMVATTVFNTLEVPSVDAVFADTSGGIYLVRDDPAKSFPAARIAAPLKDLDSLTFAPTAGFPVNSFVQAASGTRLITFRQENGGTYNTFFSLENAAATGSAQNAGEQDTLASMGQTYANSYLAQSPTGGLLWTTDTVTVPDGGPATTTAARVVWVLADDKATKFDGTTHVDMTTYAIPGFSADLAGPAAWVDDNDAIVISAPSTNTAQSLVQLASRNGTPGVVPNHSFQLAFHPSELAIVSSNTFGYVLTPDPTTGANVHVFGTACKN